MVFHLSLVWFKLLSEDLINLHEEPTNILCAVAGCIWVTVIQVSHGKPDDCSGRQLLGALGVP